MTVIGGSHVQLWNCFFPLSSPTFFFFDLQSRGPFSIYALTPCKPLSVCDHFIVIEMQLCTASIRDFHFLFKILHISQVHVLFPPSSFCSFFPPGDLSAVDLSLSFSSGCQLVIAGPPPHEGSFYSPLPPPQPSFHSFSFPVSFLFPIFCRRIPPSPASFYRLPPLTPFPFFFSPPSLLLFFPLKPTPDTLPHSPKEHASPAYC